MDAFFIKSCFYRPLKHWESYACKYTIFDYAIRQLMQI